VIGWGFVNALIFRQKKPRYAAFLLIENIFSSVTSGVPAIVIRSDPVSPDIRAFQLSVSLVKIFFYH
jgi:hypothetical protein